MTDRRVLISLLLLPLVACHIKEDRSACPCFLRIGLREAPGPVSLHLLAPGFQASCQAGKDTVMVVPVPRGEVRLVAVSGAQIQPGQPLQIPGGEDCPPVYLFSEPIQTHGDSLAVSIRLHKHFCTLRLELDGVPGWGPPYQARVRGRVDGLDLDGTPSGGPFSCQLDIGSPIRLPRQAPEEELWLDIVMSDKVLRSFALGSYLLEAGYDWTAPDLEDLSLRMRLSVTSLLLQMDAWHKVIPLNLEI